jgi:NCAIR mutase (PurE)-related protein
VRKIKEKFPEAIYHERARVLTLTPNPIKMSGRGTILVISAGTSDIPIAEEAAITARFMGNEVETIHDLGVAGIHRILSHRDKLAKATVIIVAAGMEGALPSVEGGLVDKPVIALPTSVGYGASFQGIAALLGMLNSCAAGVTVVNIDNGFGAGYAASLINRGLTADSH